MSDVPQHNIEAIRTFNRFYTQRIGVLDPYLGSDLSLTEVRVLYELAQRTPPEPPWTAAALCAALALDAGYMSRILRRFDARHWLHRARSTQDARQQHLSLSSAGRKAFAPLQKRSQQEAADLLAPLPAPARQRLLQAMHSVQAELAPTATLPSVTAPTITLREPQPGDIGWVVQQHAEIYAREYGWTSEFEALVAGIAADFLRKFQPEWERCWIAELNGERAGAVFVVRKSKTTAQLRMLILTPAARGLGLGARLTDECIAFARAKGYQKMVLWTNSELLAARAIYAKRGFRLTRSEAYRGFGHDLVGETWELRL